MLASPHMDRLALALAFACVSAGCSVEIVDTFVGAGADDASVDVGGDSGDELGEGEGDEFGGGAGDEGTPAPLFDVGGGLPEVSSCQFAAEFPSHIGCEFFGLDLDQAGLADFDPYGFVVLNPLADTVEVELSRHSGRSWQLIEDRSIAGQDAHLFLPSDNQVYGTGIHPGSAFRIRSSQPVVVVQSGPVVAGASSSATMLQPAAAWTNHSRVIGWRTHEGVGERSFLGLIARNEATPLTLDLSFGLVPGGGIELPPADDPLQLVLGPGELARLDAAATDAEIDHGISGTDIHSGQEHPFSVFAAHTCGAIPDYDGSCGHMQEQLTPQLVGERFVAPRLVSVEDPELGLIHERTMVQVVPTEPNTLVRFVHDDGVEFESVIVDPDEPYAVYTADHDLAVIADRPVLVAAYMTNTQLTGYGSPSMVQLAPVEQWTGTHWVWLPAGFDAQLLVSTRSGATIQVQQIASLDDDPLDPLPPQLLELVGVSAPEIGERMVARVPVGPGVHRVETSEPSSVVVAGWRPEDGFAYLGGWGASLAGLGPEG